MRRLLIGSLLVVGVVLTSVGIEGLVTEPPSSTTPAPTPTPTPEVREPGARPAGDAHAAPHLGPDPTTPTRLRLGAIDAPVVPVELAGDGSLTPPSDPSVLGWWGRPAGAAHGTTLLIGHTVHDGGGELDDLEYVPVGAVAIVDGIRYVVTSNRILSKAKVIVQSGELFDQLGPHQLVVVTCEDYDPATGHYASNVVLTATRS